jgi:hypothetical protein
MNKGYLLCDRSLPNSITHPAYPLKVPFLDKTNLTPGKHVPPNGLSEGQGTDKPTAFEMGRKGKEGAEAVVTVVTEDELIHKLQTIKNELQDIPNWELYARSVFFNECKHIQKRANGSITRNKQIAARVALTNPPHGPRIDIAEK